MAAKATSKGKGKGKAKTRAMATTAKPKAPTREPRRAQALSIAAPVAPRVGARNGKPKSPVPAAPRPTATDDRPLVLALPKGRILEEAAAIFARAGYDLSPVLGDSRRLVHECGPLRVLVLRSSDVPTYVAHGAADVGVAGSDVLDEAGMDLYEPLDLAIGVCRMIVAERADQPVDERSQMHLRIASKYPRTTREYLRRRGLTAEVIELSGAIELGPLTGLCDRIVDITQTGETLRQNGLVEVDIVAPVSSRLVVNPASLKLRGPRVADLLARLEQAVAPN
jgi:ATP phosphoribosyltransferase